MCHIHIYAYTYRESIKCRSIDRDRSAQPDVKKQIGFKKSVFSHKKLAYWLQCQFSSERLKIRFHPVRINPAAVIPH